LKKSALLGRGVEGSESTVGHDSTSPSDGRAADPLLSVVVLRESSAAQPTTLVRGNRTLLSLNLSRNLVGPTGMTALLDALLPLCRDPPTADPTTTGLLRVAVHGNRAPGTACLATARRSTTSGRGPGDVDSTARYIRAAMASRDPLLRLNVGGKTTRSMTNIAEF